MGIDDRDYMRRPDSGGRSADDGANGAERMVVGFVQRHTRLLLICGFVLGGIIILAWVVLVLGAIG